jgi:hypothetical protein
MILICVFVKTALWFLPTPDRLPLEYQNTISLTDMFLMQGIKRIFLLSIHYTIG